MSLLAGEALTKAIRKKLRTWPGASRYDLGRLIADPHLFPALIEAMAAPFEAEEIRMVAGIESMGLLLAGGIAARLKAPAAAVRKEGRTPWGVVQEALTDYSEEDKVLELAQDRIPRGARVLMVDDWSETGAQLKAAASLVRRLGAVPVGAACIGIEPKALADPDLASLRLVSVLPPESL